MGDDEDKAGVATIVVTTFALWCVLSIMGSAGKTAEEACSLDYPIDYIIYTGLFCEIGE
jgi:hypothetical protein